MSRYIRNYRKINDLTLRDGIQNLKSKNNIPIFRTGMKLHMMNRLYQSNIDKIEIGSNVSPKIVEMENTKLLVENSIMDFHGIINNDIYQKLYILIPSYDKYLEYKRWRNIDNISHLSLITACSETFINKNIKMNFKDNLENIDKILDDIEDTDIKVRLYISTCFGCPFEGSLNFNHLRNMYKIFNKYSNNEKVDEIVISDTIGEYTIENIDEYMLLFGNTEKVGLHIHTMENDTNLKYIIERYILDLKSIDTSLGNLGGCNNIDRNNIKSNLSTLKVAKIINKISNTEIYDINILMEIDNLIKKMINNN